jgi:hypothetical protein
LEKKEFEKMHDIKELLEDKRISHSNKSRELQEYVEVMKTCRKNSSNLKSLRNRSKE